MAKFREKTLSINERTFVITCLRENLRVDRRAFDEWRELQIDFGRDWGSVIVSLGDTRVLAQVSCEIQSPNSARPSEGILYVNLELNPIAAPNFEPGRQTDQAVLLNRLLEKCIKDSKAVDLESLCIKVNEKVWAFRVDCNVLNYEGNIVDCASIAVLAALAHFRRPDVTCDGEEVIIHTYAQRDSIPTVLHHYPVCLSYGVFSEGEILLADPTLLEEQVSDAQLTIGLNSYQELCGFHLSGRARMSPEHILGVTQRASARAAIVINQIKEALNQDAIRRNSDNINLQPCFNNCHLFRNPANNVQTIIEEEFMDSWQTVGDAGRKRNVQESREESVSFDRIASNCAALVPSKWQLQDDDDDDDEDDELVFLPPVEEPQVVQQSDGSEEEATIVLNADRKTNKHRKRKNK